MKHLFRRLNSTIGGGAIIIAFFSVISKIIGLVRDRLLAHQFGASSDLDIYFAAFKIPDFVFNILVLGALTSAFIPIFQKKWRADAKQGLILANSTLNFFLIIMFVFCLVIWIFSNQIVPLLVPGFDAASIAKTIVLTRILLMSLLFFTFSNILSGILNSWKKFFSFALSSVVYNLGIIAGIVYFYPLWGLKGLTYGVVLGAALHLLVQLIEAIRNGWRYQPIMRFSKDLKRILTLMVPRTIGLAGYQINFLVITFIASQLPSGSLSIFNFANNLQSFPIGIFGISLAVAAFPSITKFASENDHEGFKNLFSLQFRRILFFLLPISILLLILRAQIVRVVLGSGSFDWEDTLLTANSLGIFALSIFAQGLIPLVARAFYALEDTKTPVIIGLLSIIVNVILSFVLGPKYGVIGLTSAFTIASIINLIGLIAALRMKVGDIDDGNLISSTFRIFCSSLFAGLATYGTLFAMSYVVNMRTFVGIFTQGLVAGCVGILVYLAIGVVLNFPEVTFAKRFFNRFLRLLRS